MNTTLKTSLEVTSKNSNFVIYSSRHSGEGRNPDNYQAPTHNQRLGWRFFGSLEWLVASPVDNTQNTAWSATRNYMTNWIPAFAGMTNFKTILICLALVIATPAHAEELGRLFFTPEQRAQLEYSQQQNGASPNNARVLTVNGIVQKHGGERTVWINGVPQLAGKSDELAPESLPVAVPGQSKPVKVKVGQRLLLDSPPQHKPAENKPSRQNSPASDD